MKHLKTLIIAFTLTVPISHTLTLANNVTVASITLTGQNTTTHITQVQFTLSWDNSWRINSGPANWDACWVFVKYHTGNGVWKHATLNTSGHTPGSGNGTITVPSDGKGAFVYRATSGSGTFTLTNMQLQWNYGTDAVADNATVTVRVFAIEMVYVPQGAFVVGDGATDASQFTVTTITTATANVSGGYPIGQTPPNATWPNGYNAFYCMKYEVTEEQYIDFLNTLTYAQQSARTMVAPNSVAGTKVLNGSFRNGVEIVTPGISATVPAVYGSDMNDDGIYNQNNDGQNVACNWLSWADHAAYIDWAALRPMSELEYEKACRGSLSPLLNEYSWASTNITRATGISNGGQPNEVSSNVGANCNYNGGLGPVRAGAFASASTNDRQGAGATYFGIMEMSGNLWEDVITIGISSGRAFTGTAGDGTLDATGNANVVNWPASTGSGVGARGGSWAFEGNRSRVSDRSIATVNNGNRTIDGGFRCVRTAP